MLFQLKKLPEIINFTRFLKSFWMLYIDQIIVYNFLHNKRSLSDAHFKSFSFASVATATQIILATYHYIRKMRRGDRLPLTQNSISVHALKSELKDKNPTSP